MPIDGLERLRSFALTLPEVTEQETWGDPTFRVRGKIFVMHKQGDGRSSAWCKASPGAQQAMVASEPERYFVPAYVGHHGWVGIRLDTDVDWSEVEALVEEGYRMTAPKRLVQQLETA